MGSDEEIALSLGGVICDCSPEKNGHLATPLGPAGSCPFCKAVGPFYQQALAHYQAIHDGVDPHEADHSLASKYKKIDWKLAFKEEPEEVEWLKEDFIESGTLNCLFSKPGIGKSLISLEIAIEVARSGRTVMYLDDENRAADIVDRMRAFGVKPEELDNLNVYSFQNLPPLDTDAGGIHLDALAEQDQPALVILDTISRMIKGSENDADTYIQLYRCSLTRLKARGIAVLRLDHVGKDSAKGQRGSSAKESDADVLWALTREGDTTFTMECQKSRSGHVPFGTMINLERKYEPLHHIWNVQIDMPLSKYEVLMRWMDELGIPTSLGRDKTRKILADHGRTSMRNDQLQAAIIERRNRERRRPTSGGTNGNQGTSWSPSGVINYETGEVMA